ncbi:tetratricopeptide repeat protein, partial [Nitrospinota bacterium]
MEPHRATQIQELKKKTFAPQYPSDMQEAETIARQILQDDPDNHEALHCLGILLQLKGRAEEALDLLHQSTQLNPASPVYIFNLGRLHALMGNLEAAEEAFQKTIKLAPGYGDAHTNLGFVKYKSGLFQESEFLLKKALEINPKSDVAFLNLAVLQLKTGRNIEAEKSLETLLSFDPDNQTARHLVASLRGESAETAPEGYVTHLFDVYAGDFDSHLTERLRYRVPSLLRDAVGRVVGEKGTALRILDLGCGTGLCGPLFRDIASHLNGVDLS